MSIMVQLVIIFLTLLAGCGATSKNETYTCLAYTTDQAVVPCHLPFKVGLAEYTGCFIAGNLSFCPTASLDGVENGDNFYSTLGLCLDGCPKSCSLLEYECNGVCIPQTLPCGNECLLDTEYPDCSGTCVSNFHINDTWLCNGRCQPKYLPCEGKCAYSFQYDCINNVCLQLQQDDVRHGLCDGTCQEKIFKCNGSCFQQPPNEVLTFSPWDYQGCSSDMDRCVAKRFVCNGFDPARNDTCGDLSEYSRAVCESETSGSVCSSVSAIKCSGSRPGECVERASICDGAYDCVDRSDESNCSNVEQKSNDKYDHPFRETDLKSVLDFQYSSTNDTRSADHIMRNLCNKKVTKLNVPEIGQECLDYRNEVGIRFGHYLGGSMSETPISLLAREHPSCFAHYFWCNKRDTKKLFMEYMCPNLSDILTDQTLCGNTTFWKEKECLEGYTRCSGNYPGKCYDNNCRCKKNCLNGCPDNSHFVCSIDEYCSATDGMVPCADNITCVHRDLMCDGHVQCPDGSDEDVSTCSRCPNDYVTMTASFSCKHHYTGLAICAVPCNGRDDNCLGMEDEKCQPGAAILVMFLFGGCFILIVTVFVGEENFKKSLEIIDCSKDMEMRTGQDTLAIFLNKALSSIHRGKVRRKNLKKERMYKYFSNIHGLSLDQAVGIVFAVSQPDKAVAFCKLILSLEMQVHKGNKHEVQLCLKEKLGPSETTKTFFDNLEPKGWIATLVLTSLKKPLEAVSGIKIVVMSIMKAIAYNVDLVKDSVLVVFLLASSQLISLDQRSFSVYLIMFTICSIICAMLMNVAYMFTELKVKKNVLILNAILFPILPMIVIYQTARHELEKNKLQRELRRNFAHRPEVDIADNRVQLLKFHEQKKLEWLAAMVNMRLNENVIEHINQLLVLIIFLGLRLTNTNTLDGLQEAVASGDLSLLLASALWSVFTLSRGPVSYQVLKQGNVMTFSGIIILSVHYLIAVVNRIAAILMYFAPLFGLFDLLGHWKMGSLPVTKVALKVHDVFQASNGTHYPTFFHKVWIQIKTYQDMTVVSLELGIVCFFIGTALHFVVTLVLKIRSHQKPNVNKNKLSFVYHIFHNYVYPLPIDDNPTWESFKTEMKPLHMMFVIENLVLCLPMWILYMNIIARNDFLDKEFPQLQEERVSTLTASILSIVAPITFVTLQVSQWFLMWLYYKTAHPWLQETNFKRNNYMP